jgi:transcriptional regulator CtsR
VSNLADVIEEWILRRLSDEQDDIIVLKRNEMAEEMECAPSQISYVLNTRFTSDRGFIVESRRGLGGFVRIARIPVQKIVYKEAAQQIENKLSIKQAAEVVERLKEHGVLTLREAVLMQNFIVLIHEYVEPEKRPYMLKDLLMLLADGD